MCIDMIMFVMFWWNGCIFIVKRVGFDLEKVVNYNLMIWIVYKGVV